ncbi:hypothetical protein AVEN_7246-1 [Araneus ventricosus]|uniref:Uncharacterized protein n=1 Tax=Araneus ventricosus TaxID=182803 RepID=A0A4Y2HM73_ARAVE|nr:hypothetical protein AVEN_7246-1 [Araneus ventricosus]
MAVPDFRLVWVKTHSGPWIEWSTDELPSDLNSIRRFQFEILMRGSGKQASTYIGTSLASRLEMAFNPRVRGRDVWVAGIL